MKTKSQTQLNYFEEIKSRIHFVETLKMILIKKYKGHRKFYVGINKKFSKIKVENLKIFIKEII